MRITFDGGEWWDIKEALTRGDRLAINEASQMAAVTLMAKFSKLGVELETLQKTTTQLPETARASLEAPDASPEEDNAMLLRGTTAWSWEQPVNLEAVLERDEAQTDAVLAAMRTLYTRRNGSGGDDGGGKGNSGKPSSTQTRLESQLVT